MKNIKVEILNKPDENLLFEAISKPYANDKIFEKSLEDKRKLVKRVCIDNKHESVLEHLVFTFNIEGISRLCLQELVRHRIASFTVESTRFTLKRIVNSLYGEKEVLEPTDKNKVQEFFVDPILMTGNINKDLHNKIFERNLECVRNLKRSIDDGVPSDQLKYILNENFRTNLTMTINARSLRNFFELRTKKSAHFEIRYLAILMFKSLPKDLSYLFDDVVSID